MAKPTWDILLRWQITGIAGQNINLIPEVWQSVDVSDRKITTLADPTAAQDAVNLRTLNSAIAWGSDFVWGFDASGGSYPTTGSGPSGEIIAWDRRYITVGWTLNNGTGNPNIVEAGDELVALVNDAVNNDEFYALERNRTFAGGDGITLSATDVVAVDIVPTISGLEFVGGQLQVKWLADYSAPVGTNIAIWQDGAGNIVVDSSLLVPDLQGVLDAGSTATLNSNVVINGNGEAQNFTITETNNLFLRSGETATLWVDSFGSWSGPYRGVEVSRFWWQGNVKMVAQNAEFQIGGGLWGRYNDFRSAGSRTGITYFADYSADFVARSLVDKEYVDNAVAGATITAGNGITNNAGTFDLGWTLTDNIVWDWSNGPFGVTFDQTDFVTINSDASVGSGNVTLSATSGPGGDRSIVLDAFDNHIQVTAPSGAEYAADYSAANAANDRRLTDKWYVDSVVAETTYRQLFVSGDLTWWSIDITHNLNEQFVSVSVYDETNRLIQPDDIVATSSTVTTIDLTNFVWWTGNYKVVIVK